MNSQKTLYLSKKGFKELKKHIARLETDLRRNHASLRELDKGDARDERLERSERLALIDTLEAEIAEKKQMLTSAKHLPRKRDAFKVAIGSVVELLDTNGRVLRYTIVDSIEANPSDGRISIVSPLGRNLLGKQLKDIVEWTATVGTRRLQLIGIS
jgi:transcription elongation factor GreA